MGKTKDLTGERFGRLIVVGRAGSHRSPSGAVRATWLCRCECGNMTTVTTDALRKTTKSCGCYGNEIRTAFSQAGGHRVHGGCGTRLYTIWKNMKSRCSNPKNQDYHNYGGRGITICTEWLSDFATFREWALSNGYREDLSIDRIDSNGNYCPDNCRWETALTQGQNRRTTSHIVYNENEYTCVGFAKLLNVSHASVSRWLKAGMKPEEIVDYVKNKS